MRIILTGAAPLALLAACSGGGDSGALQPGEWEMTTRMTEVDIPGMPEEALAEVRRQMGDQAQTSTRCITAEEAADPGGNLFAPSEAGDDCEFAETRVEGGVIDVAGTCRSPDGQSTARMSVQGSYTPTTMEAEISVDVEGGPMEMNMSGTMDAERTGECEA